VRPSPEPLERLEYDVDGLMTLHPPVWRHPNKVAVFAVACPPGTVHRGRICYTRWPTLPLPDAIDPSAVPADVVERPGFYDYAPALEPGAGLEWHVNFADPHLFVAYGSSLFAQDELQVAEHPALGALKEALASGRHPALTVDAGSPTPVLVTGVPRRCAISTAPDPDAGRSDGLYGAMFSRATPRTVREACIPVEPPTLTNVLAMAAPRGGRGAYRREEIVAVLTTAFTGFRATVVESLRAMGPGTAVAVHSGFWGCGAFGGNRTLMALLQWIAADMAGIDLLVLHSADPGGRAAFAAAVDRRDEVARAGVSDIGGVIDRVQAMGFQWGVGDGS
jgi:Poly (ADP-ribose) glycohydrolase (PARG), Macro domain fold